MRKQLLSFALWILAVGCKGGESPTPPPGPEPDYPRFSFCPNQCAGSPWHVLNGHLDDSFGVEEHWPVLLQNLKESGGAFSLYAAEIGHLSTTSGLLPLLKEHGIPISVEIPGMTQCIDGGPLGEAEFNGKPVNGVNIFATNFMLGNPVGRPNPDLKGWFYTNDRKHFIPDEILLDERQPNLCPEIDPMVLATTQGTFEQRLNAAKKTYGCAASRLPMDQLLAKLRRDYIDYLTVAKEKWGDRMPKIGIHWNVIAGWEWRDQKAMTAVNERNPEWYNFPSRFHQTYNQFPDLHLNCVTYLNELVDELTAAGLKPTRVLMDVGWGYDMPYVTKVLKAHRDALAARGIQMGINIIGSIWYDGGGELEYVGEPNWLVRKIVPGKNPNLEFEDSTLALIHYLKGSGVMDDKMLMRVCSWENYPAETGAQVDETIPGSMAHLGNAVYELLKN